MNTGEYEAGILALGYSGMGWDLGKGEVTLALEHIGEAWILQPPRVVRGLRTRSGMFCSHLSLQEALRARGF